MSRSQQNTERVPDRFRRIELQTLELKLSCLDLREIEKIIQKRKKNFAARTDNFCEFALLLR